MQCAVMGVQGVKELAARAGLGAALRKARLHGGKWEGCMYVEWVQLVGGWDL